MVIYSNKYWYATYMLLIPGCQPNYYSRVMKGEHPVERITKDKDKDKDKDNGSTTTHLIYSCEITKEQHDSFHRTITEA